MLRLVRVPPWEELTAELARVLGGTDAATVAAVARILAAVRDEGDAALQRFQREFDRVELMPAEWEIPRRRWDEGLRRLDPAVRGALERAAARIRAYQEGTLARVLPRPPGEGPPSGPLAWERSVPMDRVGVYVPGGQAAYPSTVLMNVIPARVAGVREIIAVTPPAGVTDAVLGAFAVAGVDRVFQLGGAQAIAALAFGTATIPRVDKIVGPGNRWVAEAKRQVSGAVGIDMIAGPTEVLVIADDSADPRLIAADLLAQAEHDEDACCWLVTPVDALVEAVDRELAALLARAPRAHIAGPSLALHGVAVVVPDLTTAIEVANRRAPEHLELLVRQPETWLSQVTHAGAVFLGANTPEPVGDYIAGPSHVLPTGGAARFASPLGVQDFLKRMSVMQYTREQLELDARDIIALAEAEGLSGHAEAIRVRLGEAGSGKREE